MSYGLVICGACKREVHQDGPSELVPHTFGNGSSEVTTWRHCEDKTPRCAGASSKYPESTVEIVGPFCGRDDVDHLHAGASYSTPPAEEPKDHAGAAARARARLEQVFPKRRKRR